MSPLRAAWLVARKDLQLEIRTKEILTSTGLFAVLVVTLGSLAFYTDPVSSPNVAPGVLWISILFCGILLIGRSWALERENDAIFALLAAPIPRASIYAGKMLSALFLLFVIELLLVPLCLIFFQIEPSGIVLSLLALVALGSMGFVSTATLFSAVGIRTRARDLMLSVLVFPLVAPALLAAAVATRELFAGATAAEIVGWIRILAAFDLLFFGFGAWVSRHLLAET
jgi:heme exporter protein B